MSATAVQLPAPARTLLGATVACGAAVLAWQLRDLGAWSGDDVLALGLLAAAVAASEQFWIPLRHGTETENFSLTDGVFAAGLILVRPSVLLLGVAIGAAGGQAARGVAPRKLAFNVGQFALALGLAAGVYAWLDPPEPHGWETWLAGTVAMAACVAVNVAAIGLAIALVERRSLRDVVLPTLGLDLLHAAGNVALGMLAALLLLEDAAALPLLALPLTLAYLTYRCWIRTARERDEMRALAIAADAIALRGELERRLPDREGEGRALASTLNRMLDGIEGGLRRERWFLREASHELRTPITICRGHLEVLGADAERERVGAAIDVVLDELRRMGRIVDDMGTLARADAPDFLHTDQIDLPLYFEELAAKVRPLVGGRLEIEPAPHATVTADRHRLTQAMVNLLHNVALHTPAGTQLHARVVAEPGAWRFEVTDAGGGLEPGIEDVVFEPFYRGPGNRGGSGLGLAITRRIAEAHGGSAGVENRPGVGATFWLRVPR